MRCIISLNVQCCSLLFSPWIKSDIPPGTVQLPLRGNLSLPLPSCNNPSPEGSTPAFSRQFQVTFMRGKCKISVSQPLKIKQPNPSKKPNKPQLCSLSQWPLGLYVCSPSVNAFFRGMSAGGLLWERQGCGAWAVWGCWDAGMQERLAELWLGEPRAAQAGVCLSPGLCCPCPKPASME